MKIRKGKCREGLKAEERSRKFLTKIHEKQLRFLANGGKVLCLYH